MKRPITRSCMRSVFEKQVVRRTKRLILVRRLMCLLSIFGTFRIPVDSFQETSGGSRMLIRISNRYDSSTSTTNQRQRNEVYQTPQLTAPDAYPYRHARVAASRCLLQNDVNRKSLSNIQDLPLPTAFDGEPAVGNVVQR